VIEPQQIDDEQALLQIGRRKMAHLRRQFLIQGSQATFSLLEDMRFTAAQIYKSKSALRQWGIITQDSPNDDLPPFELPALQVTEERTPTATQASTFLELEPVVNGDLGFGLQIGGAHEGAELLALACPEHQHQDAWVRSGWLYSNYNAGAYLAVAFFKINRSRDNTGYIHIRDVAGPPHVIWLKSPSPQHQQAIFHYTRVNILVNSIVQPAVDAIDWNFTWL
jgi:hypothetical protein